MFITSLLTQKLLILKQLLALHPPSHGQRLMGDNQMQISHGQLTNDKGHKIMKYILFL